MYELRGEAMGWNILANSMPHVVVGADGAGGSCCDCHVEFSSRPNLSSVSSKPEDGPKAFISAAWPVGKRKKARGVPQASTSSCMLSLSLSLTAFASTSASSLVPPRFCFRARNRQAPGSVTGLVLPAMRRASSRWYVGMFLRRPEGIHGSDDHDGV